MKSILCGLIALTFFLPHASAQTPAISNKLSLGMSGTGATTFVFPVARWRCTHKQKRVCQKHEGDCQQDAFQQLKKILKICRQMWQGNNYALDRCRRRAAESHKDSIRITCTSIRKRCLEEC